MEKPKIFVFAPDTEKRAGDTYVKLEEAGCELAIGSQDWRTPGLDATEIQHEMAQGADAYMGTSNRSNPVTRELMEASPDLRIVAKYSIGVDDVDVQAATDLGIIVTHGPTEANWGGVAEGTIAMILAVLKKTRERDEYMKQGEWRHPAHQGRYLGYRQDGNEGITIGIVGLGRIGRRVCDLLAPWRVRLLAYDPYVRKADFNIHNAQETDFDTLLAESDVVSMHVIHTEETDKMINAETLAKMKPSAILVNTARGAVVDEAAVVEALENDTIASAALDAFADEPLSPESPLLKLGHKVLLSPHAVQNNVEPGIRAGIGWARDGVLKALAGEVPDHVYNPEVLPRWRERFEGKKFQLWPANR
ncbi:MAG: D-glycerate dehydrogenase [Rhodospirillaceae bacterium]|nr:D-glycerate dehydrogenase [Rhodospirillaceae bacterium]